MINVAEDKRKLLQAVDLAGIGNLLEYLKVKAIITCEERDRIIVFLIISSLFLRDIIEAKMMCWSGQPVRTQPCHCPTSLMKLMFL